MRFDQIWLVHMHVASLQNRAKRQTLFKMATIVRSRTIHNKDKDKCNINISGLRDVSTTLHTARFMMHTSKVVGYRRTRLVQLSCRSCYYGIIM